MSAGTPAHTHSPAGSSRPLCTSLLSQGCFQGVRMPQCAREEEVCMGGVLQALPSLAALGRGGSCSG